MKTLESFKDGYRFRKKIHIKECEFRETQNESVQSQFADFSDFAGNILEFPINCLTHNYIHQYSIYFYFTYLFFSLVLIG